MYHKSVGEKPVYGEDHLAWHWHCRRASLVSELAGPVLFAVIVVCATNIIPVLRQSAIGESTQVHQQVASTQ